MLWAQVSGGGEYALTTLRATQRSVGALFTAEKEVHTFVTSSNGFPLNLTEVGHPYIAGSFILAGRGNSSLGAGGH